MRKSSKDDSAEGEKESKPVRKTTRRRAVVKTDRKAEEWSPSAPPASGEAVTAPSESALPPAPMPAPVSEHRQEAAPVAEADSNREDQVAVAAPVAEVRPADARPESAGFDSVPSGTENAHHGHEERPRRFDEGNRGDERPEGRPQADGMLSPREERAAKWGRFQRGRHGRRGRGFGPQEQAGMPQPAQPPRDASEIPPPVDENGNPLPPLPAISLKELEDLSPEELNQRLETVLSPEEIAGMWRRHDLINHFVRAYMRRGGMVLTSGIIEVTNEGHGFLRSEKASYLPCPEDVYVAQQYVRRFNLRTGDFIEGPIRDPRLRQDRGKEKYLALGHIDTVNGRAPAEWRRVIPFENLTPIFPDRRIFLETDAEEASMRIMNLFAPIGFGQRGIIVAPPRTGKTVLMQKIANAITKNHPEAYLIVLLIDERPEEVTDMQRNTSAHVVSSTFDEAPERHAQVAEMVIEMSKRMVESGKDVIILLDSITRLARAYNTLQPNSGRILSGGVDAMGLHKPKRFFGAARNIENGGSLTIIATALIDTGSRMDEVIFEEFKGTGNMELVLDRSLSDKRIYPAIDIEASGTRKEDLILHPDELPRIWSVRKALSGMPAPEVMETVLKAVKKTHSNAEFLMNVSLKG